MVNFGDTLRTWRKARRLNQLQLALDAEVSSRHISFLESARARPSREMIGRLGDAMDLPLQARNLMLTQAGFATRYPGRRWEAGEMAPIRAAVEHMLAAHAPFPALAIDGIWRVMRLNGPAATLFGRLGVGEGASLLDLLLSPDLPPLIENWPEVAYHAARRLRTESAARGGVDRLDRVAERLAGVASSGGVDGTGGGPVVPTIFRLGATRLALFATIAQFGTPEDLLIDELKVEMYFPADDPSSRALRAMAGEGEP